MMEENPAQAIFANVKGTMNVADLALEYGVKNFVFISTDKAVNPSNVMGASKRIAERYIQGLSIKAKKENRDIKLITTRFGNVLGSNGSVVPLFTKQIQNGGPITVTHPDVIRYFMTIPEACQLVLEAGAMGNGGEIFIFDMGAPVKIIDLARKMIRLAGLVPEKDIEIKTIGLRPGEKLYEELLNDNSKTLPTHNSKIMIAKEMCSDYEDLFEQVDELIRIATINNDKIELVAKMKDLVPEYVSMNSHFEQLDH
jgi:FlaA1/EpsC-like NDP-sugar epimerase